MSFGSRRGGGSYQSGYSSRNSRNSYSSSNDSFDEINGFNRKKMKTNSGAAHDPAFKQPPKPPQSPNQRGSFRPNPQSFNQRGNSRPNPFNRHAHELKPGFLDPEHKGIHWEWPSFYSRAKNWHDKHKLAYYRSRCMALEFENKMLFDQITQLIEENSSFAMERGEVPKMQLPHIPALDEKQSNTPHPKGAPSTKTQPPQKKQELRKAEDKSSEDKNVETGDKEGEKNGKVKKTGLILGLMSKEELHKLYGSKSTTIQELETSLRLKFNRFLDLNKPELWPALPMNCDNEP